MSSIARLIAEMESRGIILSLVGGEIRYRSPKDALTAADRESLCARRADLIAWLAARDAGRALRGIKGTEGPLITSVAQEMWWRFAGGAEEGKPIALNIGMVGTFQADLGAVSAAIRQVIGRYDALRVSFRSEGEDLLTRLNPAEAFAIEQEDFRTLSEDAARAAAAQSAQEFCSRVNLIEGQWLTRAKLMALPGHRTMAAISSAHMIADAGTRNIMIDELRDILEHGAPRAASSVPYNNYALAERELLAGPQGAALIDYWRDWYDSQPVMKSPSSGAPLMWGNGVRIVCNFAVPGPVLDRLRARAQAMKVTPFIICLTIYALAMARWSGMERFPVRVLGDKRTSMDLANTVGLMFCADAVEVQAPPSQDFETVMRGIMTAYDASLALRIPSLHFWAPHCVRPGIEARGFPNKIPAVFNYYSIGTAREKAERPVRADSAGATWPPAVTKLPPQIWPRRSSPLFLHMIDIGTEISCSLHFYQNVVNEKDQEDFTAILFQTFSDVIGI
jgi:hypothetical protein